jgi:Arc/MetJ-type ribon-helix-helix transcriptional regulator
MAASARLMVLMSPQERAMLDSKARTLGLSAGEVVRRAVQAFEVGTEDEAAELRALIEAFDELHPETLRIADASHRQVTQLLGSAAAVRHRRRKVPA